MWQIQITLSLVAAYSKHVGSCLISLRFADFFYQPNLKQTGLTVYCRTHSEEYLYIPLTTIASALTACMNIQLLILWLILYHVLYATYFCSLPVANCFAIPSGWSIKDWYKTYPNKSITKQKSDENHCQFWNVQPFQHFVAKNWNVLASLFPRNWKF